MINKPILTVLSGQKTDIPPLWVMRQAGRYLPEYRDLRAKAGGFLDLVYHPENACEITMQPIRRYGMDGAILFSDILIIPHALGQDLQFTAGEGPQLPPIKNWDDLQKLSLSNADEKFDKIAQSVALIDQALGKEGFDHTTLIGFAGSPFTVACYMVEGGGSKEFLSVKKAAIEAVNNPEYWFNDLIDLLVQSTIIYLEKQILAGARAVKLFDSWAGILDDMLFKTFVIDPTAKIVSALRQKYPHIPIIGFPRGAGAMYDDYARQTGIQGLALDPAVTLSQAAELQKICPVQGNLDPAYLLAAANDPDALRRRIHSICDALSSGPHIFNLGHGVNKTTSPKALDILVNTLREQ